MAGTYLVTRVLLKCDNCGKEESWDVLIPTIQIRNSFKRYSSAVEKLAAAASADDGWKSGKGYAYCPECMSAAAKGERLEKPRGMGLGSSLAVFAAPTLNKLMHDKKREE